VYGYAMMFEIFLKNKRKKMERGIMSLDQKVIIIPVCFHYIMYHHERRVG